jgi:hypothetical protein
MTPNRIFGMPVASICDIRGGAPLSDLADLPGAKLCVVAKDSTEDLESLWGLFLAGAGKRLSTSGWTPRGNELEWLGPMSMSALTLSRPVGDGFVAVARVFANTVVSERASGEDAYVAVSLVAVVEYEPTTRVLRLIDEPGSGELAVFDLDEGGSTDAEEIELRREGDLAEGLEALEHLVEHVALPAVLAARSVDALLEAWGNPGDDDEDQRLLIPVTLAALERFEESRNSLRAWATSFGVPGPPWPRRRVVRQLTRYLDAAGALPEPAPRPEPALPFPRQNLGERMRQGKLRDEAMEHGRHAGAMLDRAGRRQLLRNALASRKLVVSPQWLELTLDQLERRQPAGRIDRYLKTAETLSSMAGALADVMRAVGSSDTGGTELPGWLEPPERAGYPAVSSAGALLVDTTGFLAAGMVAENSWLEVRLEDGAAELLARALGAAPTRVGPSAVLVAYARWSGNLEGRCRRNPCPIDVCARKYL